MPWRRALPAAAELSVEAVEIDARGEIRPHDLTQTAVRQVRKLLEDYDLRVSAVSFYTRRGYHELADLDRRVEATRRALEMAYQLGTTAVVNYVGRVPEPHEGPQWELLVDTLRDLASYGQRIGAGLLARTGSESGQALAALIAALPEGALGVALDPGGLVINGYSASEATQLLARHVALVHARDAVRNPGRDRGTEVLPGQGSVDFAELFGILEQVGYRGYVTVERESNRPLPELRHAIDYLRGL